MIPPANSVLPVLATADEAVMPVLVLDAGACQQLLAKRREMGGDRYDEVWEGVYVMSPLASIEHQRLVIELSFIFKEVVAGAGMVLPGANVTDRHDDWERNYRCPDVVVVLSGGLAKDIGAALVGGPDFLVEVRSPGDKSLDKLGFYASLGVRELLVVDRDSKQLELFRLAGGELQTQGRSSASVPGTLQSAVLPLAFSFQGEGAKNQIVVSRTDRTPQRWII